MTRGGAGCARTSPTPTDRPVVARTGHRQLYAADSRVLGATTGLPTSCPGYLAARPADQPGVLAPAAGRARRWRSAAPFTNFSYALQWLTFGLIALVALGYFIRLEMLQRGAREAPPRRSARRSALRRELAGEDDDE